MDEQLLPISNPDVNKQLRKDLKKGFIRKVLGIVTMQLGLTMLAGYAIYSSESTQVYMRENLWPLILALCVYLVVAIALTCCKGVARQVPGNYILLACLTLSMGAIVGFITSYYDPTTVIEALLLTLIATVAITAYSLTYKVKMSYLVGFLIVSMVSGLSVGILALVTGSGGLIKLYYFIGVIIYGLFLMFDIKRLTSKK